MLKIWRWRISASAALNGPLNRCRCSQTIRKQFIKTQPLAGMRVGACLHVTTETANLMITLRDGGANIALCASNPLSTQDDVAASLVRDTGSLHFAIKGESNDVYYSHLNAALDQAPQITMDDGADLVTCYTPSERIFFGCASAEPKRPPPG